ncbi:FprA family A-type flavoprotein [bacterium]|nr:FprA family A-type flavoprotein [bacterium]
MKPVEIKPGIFWVGGIDWDIRNFHGYSTPRGTTYNAYLIMDEKITLVDTVKHYMVDEMISRIKEIVEPSKIEYIISNHVEMDHSGGLPRIKELAPQARIYTSIQGEKGLMAHYKSDWDLQPVKGGDTLNLGKRNLTFLPTPMVHWPDNMVSYCPEDKVLFSNDSFGQHIASPERFDDQYSWGILHEEAAKYYANIVMPYGDQVKRALEAASALDIQVIAPSHGLIWRKLLPQIMESYQKWADYQSEKRAVIIYDSMWGSTRKLALALMEGLEYAGVPAVIRNLKTTDISDIMTDVIFSRAVLVGSPTLNRTMLPTVAGFLNYFRGLRPRNRIGFAFGSFGWSGESVQEIERELVNAGLEIFQPGGKIAYIPSPDDLISFREIGVEMGKSLLKNSE